MISSTGIAESQRSVAVKTTAILGLYAVVVVATSFILRRWSTSLLVTWGGAFLIAHGIVFVSTLAAAVWIRSRHHLRAMRRERTEPETRAAIARWLIHGDGLNEIWAMYDRSPADVEASMANYSNTIQGIHLYRLTWLAGALGLHSKWQKDCASHSPTRRAEAIHALGFHGFGGSDELLVAALTDRDLNVRITAARALARKGGEASVRVYRYAQNKSRLMCALLGEELRPHIDALASGPISEDLVSGETDRIRHALAMLRAWRVPLDVPLEPALRHPDREISVDALAVVSHPSLRPPIEALILERLGDESGEVVTAAAGAAGRLRLQRAVPILANLLTGSKSALECRAAATALAAMNQLPLLQRNVERGRYPEAQFALEAIEFATLRRHSLSAGFHQAQAQ